MLQHEFQERVNWKATEEDYLTANAVYVKTDMYKDQFCAEWRNLSKDMRNGIGEALKNIEEYWKSKFEQEWAKASKDAQTHANKVQELNQRIAELEGELMNARNTIAEYMVKCDEVADINDIGFVSTATMSVNYDIK